MSNKEKSKIKREKRYRRHKRIRAKIHGTAKIPRLCVFRSTKHIYVQLIDDEKGKTLIAASDMELKRKAKSSPSAKNIVEDREQKTKVNKAKEVGKLIAKKGLEKKIEKVAFDRGGYAYQGRVRALAEGAREGGLIF